LSAEGSESEPAELKPSDIMAVGIDNKTIIHHKVSGCVVCILTAEDAMHEQQQMAASASAHQHQQTQHAVSRISIPLSDGRRVRRDPPSVLRRSFLITYLFHHCILYLLTKTGEQTSDGILHGTGSDSGADVGV